MRKAIWIVVGILAVLGMTLTAIYLIRKSNANQQFIASDSKAVLSIAVDDLLLDNLDQLFKSSRKDSSIADTSFWDASAWWDAGIAIPAQLHFFSLEETVQALYSIQRLEDPKKWAAFWAQHASYSPHIQAVSNQQYVLFRFAARKDADPQDMQALLSDEKNWLRLTDAPQFDSESDAHIRYREADGKLRLQANIEEHQIDLSGYWQPGTDLPTTPQARQIRDTDSSFLLLWSNLPLTSIPAVTEALSAVSDIDESQLIAHADGYMDVHIQNQITRQQDTVIVYDYDENFNSMEKHDIQETPVPLIESVWKGDEQLRSIIPTKLFYKLHKTYADRILRLSTATSTHTAPIFTPKAGPLGMMVNFDHLPDLWAIGVLDTLRKRKVKLQVSTSDTGQQALQVQGKITFE